MNISHVFNFKRILFLVLQYLGGWLAFSITLMLIGFQTAIVCDMANIFGCLVGLKDSVTAISFVAVGTSMPDTFASRLAAKMESTADSSIGNVNGSNSVNVFLGLGIPWLIASIYWRFKGTIFEVHAGDLAFSVAIYSATGLLCILLLALRRNLSIFGKAELGGPTVPKYFCSVLLIGMWFLYISLSALEAYQIIPTL